MYGFKSNKGSMTVEASLIFPFIFLIVIGLIYISIFLYEQAYVQSLADRAAERGAAIWSNPESDMFVGRVTLNDLKKNDPYWRLFDTNKGNKEKKIETYIENLLNKYSILKSKDKKSISKDEEKEHSGIRVNAELNNYVIYKKLKVTVEKRYELPIGNALSIFGIDNVVVISAESESLINEPAEFIRNTDYAMDLGKRLDDATGNHIESIKDKLSEFINGIKPN